MIFKKKTTQLIEERAKKKQREIDHKLRLADEERFEENLREQRNLHAASIKKLEDDLQKQFIEKFNTFITRSNNNLKKVTNERDKIIRKITNEKNKIIKELFEEIKIKNNNIKDNQLAWVRITEVMPKLITAVTKFRTEKELKKLGVAADLSKASTEFSSASECEDALETVDRTFKKIGPMIEELLHLTEEDKNKHEKFIQHTENK